MVLALLLEQQKASLPVSNAGHLLLGFLKYYGRVFELEVRHCAHLLALYLHGISVGCRHFEALELEVRHCAHSFAWHLVPPLGTAVENAECPAPVQRLLKPALMAHSCSCAMQDQAVAPGQGGIISREDLPASAQSNAPKTLPSGKPPPPKLCVVDPLTGRDVAGGAHRINQASAGRGGAGRVNR